MLEILIERLHNQQCSLVVMHNGIISTYHKKGVRDLMWLIDHEPSTLQGAILADKIIGKAAAGLMVNAGVSEVYGDVVSKKAIPLFEEAGIPYSYATVVDRIVIPKGDDRCPLEEIVDVADTPEVVEQLLRAHFEEMQRLNNN